MARLALTTLVSPLLALMITTPADAEELRRPREPCSGDGSAHAVQVEPERVPIGLFYGGSELRVRVDLPSDEPVALLLEGERRHVALREKGRVWGVLWMSVGDVEFDDVPTAYILRTTAPLSKMASAKVLERHALGYDALAAEAGGDRPLFDELVKLKESEGLFSIVEGDLHPTRGSSGAVELSAKLPLSPRLPAGTYDVRALAFEDGDARCLGTTQVRIEYAGVVMLLRGLAMDHGLLYGVTAVVVALLAGIITGVVFRKGGSQAH